MLQKVLRTYICNTKCTTFLFNFLLLLFFYRFLSKAQTICYAVCFYRFLSKAQTICYAVCFYRFLLKSGAKILLLKLLAQEKVPKVINLQ